MRLVWHLPRLSNAACGMSRRARGIASVLRQRGHDLEILVPGDATDFDASSLDEIPIRRVAAFTPGAVHWSLQSLSRNSRAAQVARQIAPDIDAAISCQPEFLTALRAARPKLPAVLVACSSQLLYRPVRRRMRAAHRWRDRAGHALNAALLERAECAGFRSASAIAFDSEMTRHVTEQAYRLSPERCRVVAPTCDTNHFCPLDAGQRASLRAGMGLQPDDFAIVWSGRMADQKNVARLLEAVALVPDVVDRLLLIGDGPDRPALEARARALGIAPRVVFTGVQHDTAPWLQIADAFVLPSLVESFGVSVIEAMAAGLPCVVYGRRDGEIYCGAEESVRDGVCGFVIRDDHAPLIAERLTWLANDRARAARMGHAARQRARTRYELGRDAVEMEQILEQLQAA